MLNVLKVYTKRAPTSSIRSNKYEMQSVKQHPGKPPAPTRSPT
jgi:hypothetical protein